MAKRQPDDYIKRRDVIRAMHEKHPSWGDSNYNFIRDISRADVYTKDEVITMLKELQDELKYTTLSGVWKTNYMEGFNDSVATSVKKIQCRIDKLKEGDNGQES